MLETKNNSLNCPSDLTMLLHCTWNPSHSPSRFWNSVKKTVPLWSQHISYGSLIVIDLSPWSSTRRQMPGVGWERGALLDGWSCYTCTEGTLLCSTCTLMSCTLVMIFFWWPIRVTPSLWMSLETEWHKRVKPRLLWLQTLHHRLCHRQQHPRSHPWFMLITCPSV